MAESILPVLRTAAQSKTLRRLAVLAFSGALGWLGAYARGLEAKIAAVDVACEERVKKLAESTDPTAVDERVKVTEAKAAEAQRIAQEAFKGRHDIDVDLYLRLVSLQAADSEPDRRRKAESASKARKEFREKVDQYGPQKAAQIVLESSIPGDYPRGR